MCPGSTVLTTTTIANTVLRKLRRLYALPGKTRAKASNAGEKVVHTVFDISLPANQLLSPFAIPYQHAGTNTHTDTRTHTHIHQYTTTSVSIAAVSISLSTNVGESAREENSEETLRCPPVKFLNFHPPPSTSASQTLVVVLTFRSKFHYHVFFYTRSLSLKNLRSFFSPPPHTTIFVFHRALSIIIWPK